MKKKILSILLISILLIGLTGCGKVKETKNKNSDTKSTTDIAESFANYVSSDDFPLIDQRDIDITFIKTDEYDNPIMVLKGQGEKPEYLTEGEQDTPISEIVYFNEEGKLDESGAILDPCDIILLYDIENDKYIWSFYDLLEDKHYIIPLKEFINKNNNPTVLKSEEFNKKYVVTEIKTKPIKLDEIKDLKKTFSDLLSDNKINTITVDMKETVKTKVEEIKKKEEEASKVITAGEYTLQYGRYTNDFVDITINSDNTCSYKDTDYSIDTTDCTFEIQEYSGMEFGEYVSGYHIIFHISGQSDKYFSIFDNNGFADTRSDVTYQG